MISEPDLQLVLSVLDCGDPARVTELLGIQPTSQYRRGSRSTAPTVLPKRNAWHYKLEIDVGADLESEAPRVLVEFANSKDALRSLARDFEVSLTIVIQKRCHFELPPQLLSFCLDCNIPLLVDRY